jgi:hypothetical protein
MEYFIDFSTYINCIKEKQTNKFKKGTKRISDFFKDYAHCYFKFL